MKYGADRGDEFSLFQDIHITNDWHIHFHNIHHQIWKAGTFRGVNSLETNQVTFGDILTLKSRDFNYKLNLPLNKGYGYQTETARSSVKDTN